MGQRRSAGGAGPGRPWHLGQPATENRRPRQRCPELRADSRYNLDNAYITQHYALSSDTFAVMVKTAPEGCLQYQTLVLADRLAWELQQLPGVQTTVSLANAVRQITAGTYEGNPRLNSLQRNQDVLNYAAQQASVNAPSCSTTTAR